MFDHREEHVAHLAFVFWRHHDYVWHAAQIGDVEQSMMSRSISAGNATTVEAKLNVQILNTNIMNKLIECALQERRVDRADWLQSLR